MTKAITEEMKVHEEWYKQAHADKMSLETLPAFLNHLMKDYEHDYGTMIHALAAGAIATLWAMDRTDQGGISGFQAGAIMWQFMGEWSDIKFPAKLLQYKDMLYPQYESKFDKVINKETWEWLQKEAKERVAGVDETEQTAGLAVYSHWKTIAMGHIPFGYKLQDEDASDD